MVFLLPLLLLVATWCSLHEFAYFNCYFLFLSFIAHVCFFTAIVITNATTFIDERMRQHQQGAALLSRTVRVARGKRLMQLVYKSICIYVCMYLHTYVRVDHNKTIGVDKEKKGRRCNFTYAGHFAGTLRFLY